MSLVTPVCSIFLAILLILEPHRDLLNPIPRDMFVALLTAHRLSYLTLLGCTISSDLKLVNSTSKFGQPIPLSP
jgi:hypothetical protein